MAENRIQIWIEEPGERTNRSQDKYIVRACWEEQQGKGFTVAGVSKILWSWDEAMESLNSFQEQVVLGLIQPDTVKFSCHSSHTPSAA